MSIPEYVEDIFKNPEKYKKFWVAVGGFIVAVATAYFPNEPWLFPLTSFLVAIGVLQTSNKER